MGFIVVCVVAALAALALAQLWQYFRPGSVQRAKKIMGRNFFGPEHAFVELSIVTKEEWAGALARVPFSARTLRACKDTHILVACLPLSINALRSFQPKLFDNNTSWFLNENFAAVFGRPSWHLVRRAFVRGTVGLSEAEQRTYLPEREQVPLARTVAYLVIAHYLKVGERLFEQVFVRCGDALGQDTLAVGMFGYGRGLSVRRYWAGYFSGDLGLASERVPDLEVG